jgi:hypothetical protein
VYAQQVQRTLRVRQFDPAVQHAAAGALEARQVEIIPFGNQVLAEYGVTVMTLAINRVLAIGVVRPRP